jgi:hypothetical protein
MDAPMQLLIRAGYEHAPWSQVYTQRDGSGAMGQFWPEHPRHRRLAELIHSCGRGLHWPHGRSWIFVNVKSTKYIACKKDGPCIIIFFYYPRFVKG